MPRERTPKRDAGLETYRIEVGHNHGVKPGNIVGAIANEAELDAEHIGRDARGWLLAQLEPQRGAPRGAEPPASAGVLVETRELRIARQIRQQARANLAQPPGATAPPAPGIDQREEFEPGKPVVSLVSLVAMKLQANRDQDRVHLRDMIDVGLVTRGLLPDLNEAVRPPLDALLTEMGR